jgi:sulfur carrier protein
MKIKVNGEDLFYENRMNVVDLLTERKVKMPEMVSVEVNGKIIRRNAFEGTGIKDGDKIEFLYFMGGGSWN